MSKQKKPEQTAPKTTRTFVTTVRLGPVLDARLALFISQQRVEPDKTAVIVKALEEFLDREGIPSDPAES